MVIVRVATVLDLPESIKVPQQDVTEPLSIDTGYLPLLGLLILHTTGAGETVIYNKTIADYNKATKPLLCWLTLTLHFQI